jgi:hypothetical protein
VKGLKPLMGSTSGNILPDLQSIAVIQITLDLVTRSVLVRHG